MLGRAPQLLPGEALRALTRPPCSLPRTSFRPLRPLQPPTPAARPRPPRPLRAVPRLAGPPRPPTCAPVQERSQAIPRASRSHAGHRGARWSAHPAPSARPFAFRALLRVRLHAWRGAHQAAAEPQPQRPVRRAGARMQRQRGGYAAGKGGRASPELRAVIRSPRRGAPQVPRWPRRASPRARQHLRRRSARPPPFAPPHLREPRRRPPMLRAPLPRAGWPPRPRCATD
eukprot:scaffold48928_cov25-Tisochrysis_lutea.AAC.1